MREYGKVSPQFWIGSTGKAIRAAGPEAVIVAMYLITNPHANMLGIYYLPIVSIAHETGLDMEGACKGLRRASEAGFCAYDEQSEMVWVYEMAKFQIADQLRPEDNRVKGIRNEYAQLPSNPFLAVFFDKYKDAFHLDEKRDWKDKNASPFEAPSKPLRSQEQEQEKEKNIRNPLTPFAGGETVLLFSTTTVEKSRAGMPCAEKPDLPPGFGEWWEAYPKKVAKPAAIRAWKRKAKEKALPELGVLLEKLREQEDSEQWQKSNGEFIPHPSTYLNQHRWEDETYLPGSVPDPFEGAI